MTLNAWSKKIFDFVTENEERLEMAYDIHVSWEEIHKQMVKIFLNDVKEGLLKSSDDFIIDINNGDEPDMLVYKSKWKEDSDDKPLFAVAIEKLKSDTHYYGIWRNNKIPKVLKNKKKIDKFFSNHGLLHKEDDKFWIDWIYSKYDFSDIAGLKNLLKDKRAPLVKEYIKILKEEWMDKYSTHIDKIIDDVLRLEKEY